MNWKHQDTDAVRGMLAGEGMTIAWFCLGSVPLVEIGSQQGADVALIDFQHGLWDKLTAQNAISLLAVPALVRTADSTPARIAEALETGASGVLVPGIQTAAEARAVVQATRFPPHGTRSGGGVRPLSYGFDNYYREHREPVVGIMIWSKTSAENAADIARVEGIDFLFIGTGDLSLSLGCFPELGGQLGKACQSVLAACRGAKKACGIFTGSAEGARQRLADGFRAVVSADDIHVTKAGFWSATAQLKGDPSSFQSELGRMMDFGAPEASS